MDDRTWIWICRSTNIFGIGYDEFVCLKTKECKQIWHNGHVKVFKLIY